MNVIVHELYSETSKTIEGDASKVEAELLRLYPWLRSTDPDDLGDVPALVEHLNSLQGYEAEVGGDDVPLAKAEATYRNPGENEVVLAMLGYRHSLKTAFDAAKFLAGGQEPGFERVRQALHEADGDTEEAALLAHGLQVNPTTLKALKAIRCISSNKKGEVDALHADTVIAGHPDADRAATEIRRAFEDNFVMPVELGGKHSAGSMLARDNDSGETWLLKPGANGLGPAAGVKEDPSTQSRREAAFYHMAEEWHLSDIIPESQLIVVDGKEYAAIKLLPWSFQTLDKLKEKDPNAGSHILAPYQADGSIWKWAILDAVLGNTDRHANNLMVRDGEIKLIDHGSAMAGEGFDPAGDRFSFVPYYLRAWAPGKFSTLNEAAKLKVMPRANRVAEENVREFLNGLHATDLDKILLRYGVDPKPAAERLAKLKAMATVDPVDLAINKFWTEV